MISYPNAKCIIIELLWFTCSPDHIVNKQSCLHKSTAWATKKSAFVSVLHNILCIFTTNTGVLFLILEMIETISPGANSKSTDMNSENFSLFWHLFFEIEKNRV